MPRTAPTCINQLAQIGHMAPSADNSQPWHFFWREGKLYITFDERRVGTITFPPENPATLLAMGGVIENITKAASDTQVTLNIDFFPQDVPFSEFSYAAISFPGGTGENVLAPDSPMLQRHTNRFPYRKERLPRSMKEELEKLSQGTAHARVLEQRETLEKLSLLVRSASEIRFQTREVHEWLGESLRFSRKDVKKADGLDLRTLALPPGGGPFLKFIRKWERMRMLNQVGAHRLLARIDSAPLRKGPAIVAIVGQTGREEGIQAGRLLVRAWNRLNQQGLAVHPYYVVSDQLFRLKEGKVPAPLREQALGVEDETRRLLGLAGDEVLYMLLRVGYPTRRPPRSLRLPLEKVFTDLDQG